MKISIPHQNPPRKLHLNSTLDNLSHIDNKNHQPKYKTYLITPAITPKHHSKSNNKNFNQSQSSAILPYFIHKDKSNNEEQSPLKHKKDQTNKNIGVDHTTAVQAPFVHSNIKNIHEDFLFHRKISEQGYSDRKCQIYLRQTTEPNLGSEIQRMKNYIESYKNQIYAKKAKSPIETKKISKEKKNGENGSNIVPRFLEGKQSSGHKLNNKAMYMRQTIDPKIEKSYQLVKGKNISPFQFRTHGKKQRSNSIDKTDKIDKKKIIPRLQKNKNVSTVSTGNFWKNRAISPQMPNKIPSPQKENTGKSPFLKAPALPQQQPAGQASKPSFLSHKKSLNRFSIMKQLKNSSQQETFLCIDKKSNAIFCLKKYNKILIKTSPTFSQFIENFIKKVSFQLLSQHPNIIQVYDIFNEGDFVYTIQEYMQGGKLNQYIDREFKQKQTNKMLLELVRRPNSKQNEEVLLKQVKIMDKIFDINSALCYIHHSFPIPSTKESKRKMHAMAHGNVRTKSIMVNMGVCKLPAYDPSILKHENQIDSPPEQIIQKIYVPKSDIWKLGLVLYELCAQKSLFNTYKLENGQSNNPDYQIFNMNIPQQIQKLPNTTQLVKDLLKKLLALKLEDRLTSDIIMTSSLFRMYGFDHEFKHTKQMVSKNKTKPRSRSNNSSFTDLKRKLFSESDSKLENISKQKNQSHLGKKSSTNSNQPLIAPTHNPPQIDSLAKGPWFPKSHTNLQTKPK